MNTRKDAQPIGEHLDLCMGNKPGESFKVSCLDGGVFKLEPKAGTNVRRGAIPPGWPVVYVLTMREIRGEKHYRFYELRPSSEKGDPVEHGEFYVRGNFRIARTINNAREAREEYTAVRRAQGLLIPPGSEEA